MMKFTNFLTKQVIGPRFVVPQFCFSKFFEERDKAELLVHWEKKTFDKNYMDMKFKWKTELEKKALRRERKAEENAKRSRTEPAEFKFVVHNPREGIELPQNQQMTFAIVEIAGRQFKVTQDDLVIAEHIHDLDINTTIELNKILLIGTRDYTALGRPFVQNAKVIATVEQQTQTEKEIILKKQRRKRFRKSIGHRQQVTVLRISEIIHDIEDGSLERAVALI